MKEPLLDRIHRIASDKNSVLCVGIDPDPARLPRHLSPSEDPVSATHRFALEIVERTAEYAVAFKFNLAFFEALGGAGIDVLKDVLSTTPPDVVTIADAKRGDIGNSASFYAKSVFDGLGFDSITLSPYMGSDSVLPFLEYEAKGIFLLARTSNPGGNDFQNLVSNGQPLYLAVAREAMTWAEKTPGMLGLVAGATDVDALVRLRAVCPDAPFLIPGVGAQGGDPASVVAASGKGPILVNSSRQIIYASAGEDFGQRAHEEARHLCDLLRNAKIHVNHPDHP